MTVATSLLTTTRKTIFECVRGHQGSKGLFRKLFEEDRDIAGLLLNGPGIGDLPCLMVSSAPFQPEWISYGQEEWPIPFKLDGYFPCDRLSFVELALERLIDAVRTYTTGGHTAPHIELSVGQIAGIGPVSIAPAKLTVGEKTEQYLLASATFRIHPLNNPFTTEG